MYARTIEYQTAYGLYRCNVKPCATERPRMGDVNITGTRHSSYH